MRIRNQSKYPLLPRKLLVMVLMSYAIFTSCVHRPKNGEFPVIARVGNAKLTLAMAKDAIPSVTYKQDSLFAILRYRKNWITQELLVQEAERDGLQNSPEFKSKLHRLRQGLLAEALRSYILSKADSVKITEKDAENYYEAHEQQFILNERYVRFRFLSTMSSDSCQMAKSALMHGVTWPEVVQRYALDKDKSLNDSKRYWPISMALRNYPIMNHFLRIIGNTEISPIRFVNGRYAFVQLMDQKPKGAHAALGWVLDQIKDWLLLQKKRKLLSNLERNLYLRAEADHEIHVTDLPLHKHQDTIESQK